MHRAVNDRAGAVLLAPRQLGLTDVALDERERRLQRIDVPDAPACASCAAE
jgi:hypothetical protein